MRSNIETKAKEKSSNASASVNESEVQSADTSAGTNDGSNSGANAGTNADTKGYGGFQPGSRQDEWLLKYEVNEKGVGRILLPPSLSILLQSDRVYITPSAGGLFIRSV